jgi:hypothetical protein
MSFIMGILQGDGRSSLLSASPRTVAPISWASIRMWGPLLIVLLVPLTLSAINGSWLYTPVGFLDPWYYVGYGYHYDDPSFMENYYKASRLPWVLAQYIFRHAFSPIVANYILQIGCIWVATAAVYLAAAALFGPVPAAIASAFLAAYTHFHGGGGGGADYHNTLAGPLYAISFLLVTLAAQRNRNSWPWFMSSGAAFATAVHTNISFVNLSPILLAHLAVTAHLNRVPLRSLFPALVAALAGGVAVTGLLGCINVAFGREFLFCGNQIRLALSFVADASLQKSWWRPWSTGWYWSAWYLGPIVGIVITAAITAVCAMRRRLLSDPETQAACISLQFVFLAGLWLCWQASGQTALEPDYFAYPLIVPLSMTIAAAFSFFGPNVISTAGGLILLALVPAAMILPLTNPGTLSWPRTMSALALGSLSFSAVGVALAALGRRIVGALFATGLLGVANASTAAAPSSYYASRCTFARDGYLAVIEAHRTITRYGNNAQETFVWFDEQERAPAEGCGRDFSVASFGYSITATGFQYVQSPFPMRRIAELDREELRKIADARGRIALITRNEENSALFAARLTDIGRFVSVLGVDKIRRGSVSFLVYVLWAG